MKVRTQDRIKQGCYAECKESFRVYYFFIFKGYPRNDIDVHKVREGRNKLICLGNDLKAITLKIEAGLHNLHSQSAQSVPKDQVSTSVSLAEVMMIVI